MTLATGIPARGRRDRGSVSVELAILLPGFLALIVLAVVAGRQVIAQGAVDLAAHDAARTASISRDRQSAERDAPKAAAETLARQGLACTRLSVDVDASAFDQAVGQPAHAGTDYDTPVLVRAIVTCTVAFTDLGIGWSRTLTASFDSPLDQYRTRR